MAQVIVLDASALIALASSKDPHHSWAIEMFRDTAAFELQITALTYAEILVHPARAGKLEKFQKGMGSLGLEIAPVAQEDSAALAKLRASTSLKLPDVVVLNQAMKSKGSIASSDKELIKVARDKGIGVFHPKEL